MLCLNLNLLNLFSRLKHVLHFYVRRFQRPGNREWLKICPLLFCKYTL